MSRKQWAWAVLVVLGFASSSFGGTKEELIRLQKDLLTLQAQIRELQRSFDENAGALKLQLEQANKHSALTNTLLQAMKDSLDLAQASQKSTLADLMTELKAMNVRLDETHTRINSMAAEFAETKIQVEALKNPPRLLLGAGNPSMPVSPDQIYLAAYNDYVQGNYDVALQGFQTFLAHYRESELADNAQFYMGECFFAQKKYDEAILYFDQVINLYPDGDKIATAHLKKGMSLLESQKNEAAVEEFKIIVLQYPTAPEMNIARQRLELLGIDVDELIKKRKKQPGTQGS